jgi:hypothetical protein
MSIEPKLAFTPAFTFIPIKTADGAQIMLRQVEDWGQTAKKLRKLTATQNSLEAMKYYHSNVVAMTIQSVLKEDGILPDRDHLFCLDEKKTIQACMLASLSENNKSYLEIELLMTNPANLKISAFTVTGSSHRVQNAGMACLIHAMKMCVERNLSGIVVKPLESAIGFYQRYGFSKAEIKGYHPEDYWFLSKDQFASHAACIQFMTNALPI